MRIGLCFAAFTGTLLAGGCSSLDADLPDRDFIRNQWSYSISRLGFSAIYPPSEDVEVGDVYAVAEFCNPNDPAAVKARDPHPVKIASINLGPRLSAYYAKRLQFGSTTAKDTAKDYLPQPGSVNKGGVFVPDHRSSIPLQALPEFELARGSFTRVAASIPLPFAGLFGAFASQEKLDIAIKVPYSETYGLPAYEAIDALRSFCSANRRDGLSPCDEANVMRALASATYQVADICKPHVVMVGRVFSTRKIEYHYNFSSGSALAAQVVVTLDTAVAMQKKAATLVAATAPQTPPTGVNVVAPTNPATGAAAVRDQVLGALLTQVSNDLEELKASQAPGATFSFARFGSDGIALLQTFERPIAIGYTQIRLDTITPSQNPPGPLPRVVRSGEDARPLGPLPPVQPPRSAPPPLSPQTVPFLSR
jgi:hypothetical protein